MILEWPRVWQRSCESTYYSSVVINANNAQNGHLHTLPPFPRIHAIHFHKHFDSLYNITPISLFNIFRCSTSRY